MDHLKGMSRSSHLLLWGGTLLFIFLFFDWQQVCVSFGGNSACGGQSGWHGWGVLVGILAIALVAWEIVQLVGVSLPDLPVKPAMISAGLAGGDPALHRDQVPGRQRGPALARLDRPDPGDPDRRRRLVALVGRRRRR